MNATYRPIGADWPGKRTLWAARRDSRFQRHGKHVEGVGWTPGSKVPWNETLLLLDRELRELGAKAVVFQIDLKESDIRLDGLPRADARPSDPAVIVSFDSKHGPLRYFCDQFTDWHDNVRAIALGLEALRKVERFGITRKGEQYSGWRALPPASGNVEGVQHAFANPREAAAYMLQKAGVDLNVSDGKLPEIVVVDKVYRDDVFKRAALKVHPDQGGSRPDWDSLVEARRILETG
jgi:hypothetical protein